MTLQELTIALDTERLTWRDQRKRGATRDEKRRTLDRIDRLLDELGATEQRERLRPALRIDTDSPLIQAPADPFNRADHHSPIVDAT